MSRVISFVLALLTIGSLIWIEGCAPQSHLSSAEESGAPAIAQSPQATYWPIGLNTPDGELIMYQPQPTTLQGDQLLARAAMSWTPTGGQVMYGTAEFRARIVTDRDTRMVTLQDINSIQVHLAGATADQEHQFAADTQRELPGLGVNFPLDELLSSLDTAQASSSQTSVANPGVTPAPPTGAPAVQQFNNDPPKIIFSDKPATLISVNGPPKLLPVDGYPGVMEVANTPFTLLFDPSDNRYYLKAGAHWASAIGLTDDWQWIKSVPGPIASAGDFLATPPPGSASTQPGAAPSMPGAPNAPVSPSADLSDEAANGRIFVSTDPTELIITDGPPQFTPIPGGQLLYARNTQQNLFLYQPTQKYYLLLSGRWYVAPALLGPWQYLLAQFLPTDFQNIPTDSPKANVLASVPDTTQSREAVLNAEIPQTASVKRTAGSDLTVSYDGAPRFAPTGASSVTYAQNTPNAVFDVSGIYYCCDDAVWYQSATPTGPWTVCTSVPAAIYSISPSCPLYYTTYCYVYDTTPDYVYCGYLPGYTGCYVQGPTVVFGTGYSYGGWSGSAYFPYPCTWGYCAQYDPWACDWGFGFGSYWDTGWFAHQWHNGWWRDHWRTLDRRDPWLHQWWGPHGYVNYNRLRSHDVAARAALARGEEYGGPGQHNIYMRPRNLARNVTAFHGRFASPMPNRANDLFAGRNGQVFRRTSAGWEARSPSAWNRARGTPGAVPSYRGGPFNAAGRNYAPVQSGMQRDFDARARGQYRSNAIHNFGEFHGGSGGGAHGGGGGGMHGGGGGLHGGGGGSHGGGGGGRR